MGIRSQISNERRALANARGDSGQSLVELVVGLLALVLVLMGLLQVGRLGMERTQVLMDARRDVDFIVMSESFNPLVPGAFYAAGVAHGRDQRPHTQHDYVMFGDPQQITQDIVAHADPDGLATWMPDNPVQTMQDPSELMETFDLTYALRVSDSIEMYPIIRNLVAGEDSIRIRRTLWMPWLRGVE